MIPKIDFLSDISNLYSNPDTACNLIKHTLKSINLTQALSSGKGFQKGGRSVVLLYTLIVIKLLRERHSIHSFWKNNFYNFMEGGKNGLYRFLNRPMTNWRKILSYVSIKYREVVEAKGAVKAKCEACFIIDDTLLEKSGNTFEGISRVYDHNAKRNVLGYKMLVLAYNDGITTQACDFSLHREDSKNNYGLTKKELSNVQVNDRIKGNPDYERFKELDITKLESTLLMLKRAVDSKKFKAKYLLADSWFSSIEFIKNVKKSTKNKVDYLGIGKKDLSRYEINGVRWRPQHIIAKYSRLKKRIHKKYNCQYFYVICTIHDIKVKLIFFRNINGQDWNFLITTDLNMKFEKAYELYQVRWTIEVLFKECKQYFKLGRCQSVNFNEQIADCTIVLIIHSLVSLENRFSNYETLGGIYIDIADELTFMTLWERIIELIIRIMEAVSLLIGEPIFEVLRRLIVRNHSELKNLFQHLKAEVRLNLKKSKKRAINTC